MVLKVGYWDVRGLVEPIQMLLEYLEVDYEIKRYKNENRPEWNDGDAKNLGLEFPNVPYLIDGDFKLCQSLAISKYIGRKHGMFGTGSNAEISREEEIIDSIGDIRVGFLIMCYMDYEGRKKMHFEQFLPAKLQMFNKRLSERKWLMGDKLAVSDFMLWSTLDFHTCMEPNVLDPYEHLARFKKEFEEVPQIKKYLNSDKFKKFPICGVQAQWGGKATQD